MKDISNYVTIGDDGKLKFDSEAYNADFQSEMDRVRQQASDTARKNAEKDLSAKIRKDLEDEAKMTAEERLKADREAFLKEKQEFDRKRIETIYRDAGISDGEIAILTTLIGNDSDKNIETAQKFAAERKANHEQTIAKLKEEMQFKAGDNHPKDSNLDDKAQSLGAQMAKQFSPTQKQNDYVDISRKG